MVEFLSTQSVSVTACVATEYGETLLPPADNLTVSAKRMTQDEMVVMLSEIHYDLVIDATHPYASVVTEHIEYACNATDTEYIRLLRDGSSMSSDTVFAPDIDGAVDYLNRTEGNIFVTTGSKDLSAYTKIQNFEQRVYARILPSEASLEACRAAGMKPDHIIAMQGPFSEEINISILRFISAKYMVTKDGGKAGGFDAKATAAKKAGVELIVVGRPPQKNGMSFSEITDILCNRFGCTYRPSVTILGIGPGSTNAMTSEVRHAVSNADCLIGAKRMLEAVADTGQSMYDAIIPDKIADFIMSNRNYRRFAVVMSGDSGFFSGTKNLLPLLENCDVEVLPGLNSMAYLCARLKISYEDIAVVSLHGREHNIIPDVHANKLVFALVGGENNVNTLCRTLTDNGMGHIKMYIGERLSYDDEKITVATAQELVDGIYDTLSVVLIENNNPDAVVTHGLPDDVFERICGDSGVIPMTKSEVRSVCLSKLQLTERAVCWDIGAGTGSVSVEMALQVRKGWVYAVEQKASAVQLLHYNKNKFALDNLTVICGTAPQICGELPTPDHVFIGGSSGNMRDIIAVLLEKNPNVRIVATAVSLETVSELTSCMEEFDFTETEVICMNVARSKNVGQYHMMNGHNPVYIFTMQNGGTKL